MPYPTMVEIAISKADYVYRFEHKLGSYRVVSVDFSYKSVLLQDFGSDWDGRYIINGECRNVKHALVRKYTSRANNRNPPRKASKEHPIPDG